MKKTNKTISLIISGLLLIPVVWSTEQAQRPRVAEVLADQESIRNGMMNAVRGLDACLSRVSEAGPPSQDNVNACQDVYKRRTDDIREAAQQGGLQVPSDSVVRTMVEQSMPAGAANDAQCATQAKTIGTALSSFLSNAKSKSGDDKYNGSNTFQRCSQNSHLDWAEVVRNDGTDIWDLGWKTFATNKSREFNQVSSCNDLKTAIDSLPGSLKGFTNELVNCEAIRSITAKSDFNDAKQIIGGKQATQASLDQKIKCESRGAETRDYKACVKTLNFYNGALVGTTVFTQVQELGYQGHAIENSVLDPNDPTAGLKSQKKDIEKRAGMTQTRAGLDMAKGAALLALWQSIPTAQDVTKECIAGSANRINVINQKYREFINQISSPISQAANVVPSATQALSAMSMGTNSPTGPLRAEAISKSCGNQVSGQFVILNGGARDSIKEAMILAGIDGIKHQTAASLLKKQANEVGKVINEVDNFNPTGLEYFGEEFSGSECALNPAAEGCDDFVNQRSFGFGSNAPIQIHGMENASNFGRNNEAANPTSRDSETSPVDRSDAPKPIGIFDPAAENPSGILDPQGAASVSNDGAGAGGASGGSSGGGVAGGGSPPPPPGGAPNSQAPRMGLPNAGNSNLAYSRGTGAIRAGGGRGAQGRRGAEGDGSENPFAGLFGKENPEGANLNFRGSASEEGEINSPDTSIFQIISDRYIAVHGNDRLLMYEAQEEQGPLQ